MEREGLGGIMENRIEKYFFNEEDKKKLMAVADALVVTMNAISKVLDNQMDIYKRFIKLEEDKISEKNS